MEAAEAASAGTGERAGSNGPEAKPRVIGIFPSLWRVHMRVRRLVVSEWERPFDAKASFFLNAKGRCLASSVWRQAMRTFIEAACNRYVLEVQADLRKAFDHVSRQELWAQAKAEGYPCQCWASLSPLMRGRGGLSITAPLSSSRLRCAVSCQELRRQQQN